MAPNMCRLKVWNNNEEAGEGTLRNMRCARQEIGYLDSLRLHVENSRVELY